MSDVDAELVADGKTYRRVQLPGERCWAEVVAYNDDGTWQGRIDNAVEGPLHDYHEDDVLTFAPVVGFCSWRPAEVAA